ncbi:C25 family cysteine peptidase [Dyadobacter sp. 3J3]|uniref:putative type IX secretion system sortase PorU2 n=1 Tax=Dyadobacter sp. 3J3 TaxID=2606600 RepID=UPI0013589FAC|nr:C25 family cysteine peptidase [Dyadobacter sp. 3J3]
MLNKRPFVLFIIILFCLLSITNLYAQWGAPYSNSWLQDLHKQSFVKIQVKENGIYRIPIASLPSSFPKNDPSKFQLWHRGKEVTLISANSNEIVFYGVKNDGKSDELLYRNSSFVPDPKARTNPYFSIYSDESSYFLTISSSPVRAKSISKTVDLNTTAEKYHLQTDIVTFTDQGSYSPDQNFFTLTLIHSFLERGKGMTSKIYGKNATLSNPSLFGDPVYTFKFDNLINDLTLKPKVEVMIYGRTNSGNDVSVQVGKNLESLRTVPGSLMTVGFTDTQKQFELDASENLDITQDGNFVLKLFSNKVSSDWNAVGLYSVTYYKIDYPQSFSMAGKRSKLYTLLPSTNSFSRVSIPNPAANAAVYDVTNPDIPVIISGTVINGNLELMIPRNVNQSLSLLVTNEIIDLASSKIQDISLPLIEPSNYDYLILTTDKLLTAAKEYSDYRMSVAGGSYSSLVLSIADVYNQFNYGEPSPVAIRRFVDYMLSKGIRPKHNLLLIGNSISNGDSTVQNKELKGQVPTAGYPGSDLLLVSGLGGAKLDVPAIPVGRISATSVQQVRNYLEKVKSYESNANLNTGWKKNVLHLSGGKSASEIIELKSALEALVPLVENGDVGGSVKAFQKQSIIEVEKVNITPELNEGVGMISYFGHGSPTVTDLDMGYVSDVTRGYQNINKYPLMYFNGCGVGNIFKGNINEDYTSSQREPLSADWLGAKDKGAMSIIANSYYTFLAPSSRYIKELYLRIFDKPESADFTIGQIQQDIAKQLTSESFSIYDMSNLHQSVLQGDPAMHIIRVALPDYAIDRNTGIVIHSESDQKTIGQSNQLKVAVILSNLGKNVKDITLPIRLDFHYKDGSVDTKTANVLSMLSTDTLIVTVNNLKPLERIAVKLDPLNVLQESSEVNNDAELLIEWGLIKDKKMYPDEAIKDVIAPILSVKFNNEILKNGSLIYPNPAIKILLTDNYYLTSDTTLVDVSIKLCGDNSCDFKRVSYSKNHITLSLKSDGSLEIEYLPTGIIFGEYELLVSAKDISGNSIVQPYRILFSVSDESSTNVSVTASPNPASDYVHFELQGYSVDDYTSIYYQVYDINGIVREQIEVKDHNTTWYWKPNLVSGLYIYKIVLKGNDGKEQVLRGKIVLIK